MAEEVAQYILEGDMNDAVEYCPKSDSFKLKIQMSALPATVSQALKGCTKVIGV